MSRLEDIQKKRYFFHDIKDSELKEDWEWLIQQTERVEELEKELNGTKYRLGYKQMFAQCNRDYASINSENQSYRRILAFYGNPYKYVSGEIEKDEGKKARKILEREGNG